MLDEKFDTLQNSIHRKKVLLFDEKCETLQNSIGESKMLLFDETRRAVLQNSGFAHEMNVFWSFVHCSDVNLFFLGTVSRDF